VRKGIAGSTSIVFAVLAVAACSNSTPATSDSGPPAAATTPTSAAAASTGQASTGQGSTGQGSTGQPETAAAASAVAKQYFGLYSAGQFTAAYGLLTQSARRAVSESTWVAVHRGCPSQSAGLAYEVKDATRTGNTVIVTVSLTGVASGPASESEALTYSGGRWRFVLNDLSMYEHGSVKADLAAAKAAGYCARS
jgi:hypothetical protein